MQPFSVTVHHGPFLLIVATGDGLFCDAMGMIDLGATIAQTRKYQRILFDSIAATFRISTDEAAQLGEHLAARLVAMQRVASVVQQRSPGGVGERAALGAGLNIRTFTDL